jgi:hypothetical protein
MGKPRVIKDFDALSGDIQEQIKLNYPYGFEQHLIRFNNKEGKSVSALPYEAEDKYYLVRMSVEEAKEIIELDEDFDEDGNLKDEIKEEYEEKHFEEDEEEFKESEETDPYADKDKNDDD